MFRWIILILIIVLIEIYSFQVIKTITKSRWIIGAYLIISFVVLAYILFFFLTYNRGEGQNKDSLFAIGLLLITVLPKLVLTIILFGEDVFRFFAGIISSFSNKEGDFLPERRKFVSHIALGLAAIPFSSLLYGMTIGKYNFKVIKRTLFFPDLPGDFDGTTITHISDIHSGSFDNHEKIEYAIDLINEQKSEFLHR
uniref:hypothetical protein n=1 Tax=Flavobacterium sp. TaxID=239 RepID=UPI004048ADA8